MTGLETNFEDLLFRDSFVQVFHSSRALNSLKLLYSCPLMWRAVIIFFSKQIKPLCQAKTMAEPAHLCQKKESCILMFPPPYYSISVPRCLVLELVRHVCELTQLTKAAETNHAVMWIIFCPFLGGIGLPKSPGKAQKRRWGRGVKRSKEEWDLIGSQGGVSVIRLVLQNLRLDNHLKFQLQPEFISLS